MRFANPEYFGIKFVNTLLLLINKVKADFKFCRLFTADCAINSCLNFLNRCFAAFMNERRYIKGLAGIVKNLPDDGTRGFTEHIRKHIIQFEIGNGKAIERTVFHTGNLISQLHTKSQKITKMSNIRRWNKARFDHIAHKQIAYPFRVFAVSFIALLRFCVFGVSKRDPTGFFKNIENRNPIFTGRFHTNFCTGIFRKPVSQLP